MTSPTTRKHLDAKLEQLNALSTRLYALDSYCPDRVRLYSVVEINNENGGKNPLTTYRLTARDAKSAWPIPAVIRQNAIAKFERLFPLYSRDEITSVLVRTPESWNPIPKFDLWTVRDSLMQTFGKRPVSSGQ